MRDYMKEALAADRKARIYVNRVLEVLCARDSERGKTFFDTIVSGDYAVSGKRTKMTRKKHMKARQTIRKLIDATFKAD